VKERGWSLLKAVHGSAVDEKENRQGTGKNRCVAAAQIGKKDGKILGEVR